MNPEYPLAIILYDWRAVGWEHCDLETYSLTGWPKEVACDCGARSHMLVATWADATYECAGTPTDPHSAYGPDRCGKVFTRTRAEVEKYWKDRRFAVEVNRGVLYGAGTHLPGKEEK